MVTDTELVGAAVGNLYDVDGEDPQSTGDDSIDRLLLLGLDPTSIKRGNWVKLMHGQKFTKM
jgi:hypothetical protein